VARTFIFNNNTHYLNYCKKILRNRSINTTGLEDVLKPLCDKLYEFTLKNENRLRELNLRRPIHVFSYRLSQLTNWSELNKTINDMCNLFELYQNIIQENGAIDRDKYEELYDQCYIPSMIESNSYQLQKRNIRYSKQFAKKCEELKTAHGLYFFYNLNKELIYIGKSTSSLGERVVSSSMERGSSRFVSFAIPATKSDTNIYELYYISKFKPPLNKEAKENDNTTIILPELELTEPIPIYDSVNAVS
jgi:hypothetical protein